MQIFPDYNLLSYSRPDILSYVRVLHASPGAPPVDIYANGRILVRALAYGQFTEYLKLAPGSYNVRVVPVGASTPVINTNLDVPPGKIYTAAAIGLPANIELLPVEDPKMNIPAGRLYLRFGHLSPTAPAVDVFLPDGTVLFSNVSYKSVTDYIPLVPGTYIFRLRVTGTNNVVLYVPNITLYADRFYTLYAIGLPGGMPPLQLLVPLDGNSYIKF